MCGFAGMFKTSFVNEFDKEQVRLMSESIKHRGPDDSQEVIDEFESIKSVEI